MAAIHPHPRSLLYLSEPSHCRRFGSSEAWPWAMATLKSASVSLHLHVVIPNRSLRKVSACQLHRLEGSADYHQCMCCQASLICSYSEP